MSRGLTSTKLGAGCLTLFALPFAGVGVATLYLLGSALVASVRMSDWVEVPAVITHAELKANRGGAGKGGGTSYQAAARYTYEVGGRRYEGDRVSPHEARTTSAPSRAMSTPSFSATRTSALRSAAL